MIKFEEEINVDNNLKFKNQTKEDFAFYFSFYFFLYTVSYFIFSYIENKILYMINFS
jgi:hypothetical protein